MRINGTTLLEAIDKRNAEAEREQYVADAVSQLPEPPASPVPRVAEVAIIADSEAGLQHHSVADRGHSDQRRTLECIDHALLGDTVEDEDGWPSISSQESMDAPGHTAAGVGDSRPERKKQRTDEA
jgi:hypothetical protein